MPVTVRVNGLSLVHGNSQGMAIASAPDVCLTQTSIGPLPIPYPNIAQGLQDGTSDVKADGAPAAVRDSTFGSSTGDEVGSSGGLLSGTFASTASFCLYSFDVRLEGSHACRLMDLMQNNKGNTICSGELQEPVISKPDPGDWVAVQVRDEGGAILRGVTVVVEVPGRGTVRKITDRQGEIRINGIQPGSVTVSVAPEDA